MDVIQRLNSLGIETAQGVEHEGERIYLEKWKKFLLSFDFMKAGQAVNKEKWEAAMMAVRRMESGAQFLGAISWERYFQGLRQAIIHKNKLEAKQVLATIIQKRVQILNLITVKE